MSKFRQAMVLTAATTLSFGVGEALEVNAAYAAPQTIEQGYPNLPSSCEVLPLGSSVSKSREQLLVDTGFSGFNKPNGKLDKLEQRAAYGAQKFMQEIGVIDSDVRICGVLGSVTEAGAKKMLNPGGVNESQITQSEATSRGSVSNSIESCDSIELTKWVADRIPGSDGDTKLDNGAEASALQEALNKKGFNVGNANGEVGSRTLGSFGVFQKEIFGKIDCLLGSQSFAALELSATVEKTDSSIPQRSASFNAKADCPTKNSCEILVDLSEQKTYIKKNDRKYSTANGENLFISNAQTGGPGSETDQGHATLGRVELGPNSNPWRLSSITRAVNPQAEPNLYKFRRINPDSGRSSGEGFHGSPSYRYNVGPRSAGCVRVPYATADILSDMPTGTAITITQ